MTDPYASVKAHFEDVEGVIVNAGRGLPFDPGTGKVMKNRVLIPASKKRTWIKLCEEAAEAAG